MARNHHEDEEYIDMDISPMASTPDSRDFEFHLSTATTEKEPTASPSPADELFYRGKLLPLHLPPRMEMVEKLLGNRRTHHSGEIPTPTFTAPVGGELTGLLDTKRRQASKKKLSYLGHKLKASTAYLRSLFFFKSTRSPQPPGGRSSFLPPSAGEERATSSANVSSHHRKSFSGAINSHTHAKSTSSSSSSSSSPSSDGEDSIQGAIAYCKKSLVAGRKSASDVGSCSFSVARIVVTCEEMDGPSFGRG